MINGLSPNTFKDCTYSSSLMESTWDLAIRKQDPHPQMIKIITIFFALCPMTVSYTHLDVYKRQHPGGTVCAYAGFNQRLAG